MKRANRFCVVAVLFFVVVPSAFALQLSDIETNVRRLVSDTASDAASQRYTDAVLDALINEGQRDVVNQTWCLVTSTSLPLTNATTYYSLPTDLIVVNRVKFTDSGGTVSDLEETTETQLAKDNPDYENNSAGDPSEYFVRVSTRGADALEIGFIPVIASTSTETIVVDYVQQATDLSSDSDVPFNGLNHLYPYHDVLVYYVAARVKMMEGKTDVAGVYGKLYGDSVAAMIQKLNSMPNYRPNMTGRMK